MVNRRRLAAAALAFLLPRLALALDPKKTIAQYVHDRWLPSDGLPHNSVEAIVQTRDGYLWLGTPAGLVRFDGARFRLYDRGALPELKSNNVQSLVEGRDQSLWISTGGGGLACLKEGHLTTYSKKEGLPSELLGPLLEDAEGDLWIGTSEGGLARLGPGGFARYSTEEGLANNNVNALFRDRSGSLWIGTDGGLNRFRKGTFELLTTAQGLPSNTIYALQEDRQGALWIGTNGGLARLSHGVLTALGKKDGFEGVRVECFLEDKDGNLWIGTYGAGLYRYREGRFSHFSTADGLNSDIVYALCEDAEGSLWVGTRGGGLDRFKDGSFTTFGLEEGLRSPLVWAVYEDRADRIWVATDTGLSYLKEGQFVTLTKKDGLSSDMVRALFEDRGKSFWFGTWGAGLNRMKDGHFNLMTTRDGLAHNIVRALLEDRTGNLWIGTYGGGLDRLAAGKVVHFGRDQGLTSDHILDLLEARDGAIWVATRGGGLNRLHDGRFTALTRREGLPDDIVMAVHEDAQGSLWIGTHLGLARLKNGRVSTFVEGGFPEREVYQILEDDLGYLWISTDRGVARVKKRELEDWAPGLTKPAIVVYGRDDGLRKEECSGGVQPAGVRAHDGRLWFPTIAGTTVVDPAHLESNRRIAPVHVEEVLADGRKVLPGNPVPTGARELQFHYTALSLRTPSRVRFRYRLEGLDREWVDAGVRRVAYYTNVPPGGYRFRVIGSNDDGVWNEEGDSWRVYVTPRWYQTLWFRGLAAGLVILVGYGSYRVRIMTLEARERELLSVVADRTRDVEAVNANLREAIRLKDEVVSMVAHEFRSPLVVLQGYGDLLGSKTIDDDSRRMLGLMNDQTRRLVALTADTLTLSLIEGGGLRLEREPVRLGDMARAAADSYSRETGREIVAEVPKDPIVVDADPRRLQQVLDNLISNAVKYSPNGPRVRVTLEATANEAHLAVADMGIGIPAGDLAKLFQKFGRLENARKVRTTGTGLGLYICRWFIEAHAGRIWAESELGKGSTFHVVLPLFGAPRDVAPAPELA